MAEEWVMIRAQWTFLFVVMAAGSFGGVVPGTVVFLEPKMTILEVVRQAKSEGYKTVVVVSNPESVRAAPEPYRSANACIDEIVTLSSWRDEKAVHQIVQSFNVDSPIKGIYFGSEPQALIASKLRQFYGMASTTPEAMELLLDKYQMRAKLRENGISGLMTVLPSALDGDKWPFPAGAFFKPRHGLASLHVKRVHSVAQVRAAQQEMADTLQSDPSALKEYLGSSDDFYLEQAFEGELMSVESIVANGEVHVLGLLSRIMHSQNPVVEMGSIFPYPHPHASAIIEKVRRAHSALNFTDGPTHVEVIVSKDGDVEVIDFNPRFVGADVLQSINKAYGIRIESSLLGYAVNQFRPPIIQESGFCCLQYGLAPQGPDRIDEVCLPVADGVVFSSSFVAPGTVLQRRDRQIDYIGCYLVKADTFEGASRQSRDLRSHFKVNGKYEADY
jgi:biotin carboxylase